MTSSQIFLDTFIYGKSNALFLAKKWAGLLFGRHFFTSASGHRGIQTRDIHF
jgi:hypothetical protein